MKKMLALCFALAVVALGLPACSEQTAGEEQMTGQVHERHATGMNSQVGDN